MRRDLLLEHRNDGVGHPELSVDALEPEHDRHRARILLQGLTISGRRLAIALPLLEVHRAHVGVARLRAGGGGYDYREQRRDEQRATTARPAAARH